MVSDTKSAGSKPVLEYSRKNKGGSNLWLCQCDCGRICEISSGQLKFAKTNWCRECLINKGYVRGSNSKRWNGVGEMSGEYYSNLRYNADARSLKFNISKEYLWDLFIKQERKCAISGVELCFNNFNKYDSSEQTASVDRKDSLNDYTEENVQWIHKDVNRLKMDFSMPKLLELVDTIYQYQHSNECINSKSN